MNTSLQNILARSALLHSTPHAGKASHARVAAKPAAETAPAAATPAADFASVLRSTTAPATSGALATSALPIVTPAPVLSPTAPLDNVARLGPFSAGAISKSPQQLIADPAPLPVAKSTPLPAAQQALLNQPWDPFNQAQHEAKMNAWNIDTTQFSNQQKLTLYQKAVTDWKENAAHCQDLGIAVPPAPQVPVLAAVGPMPDGYWFGKNA